MEPITERRPTGLKEARELLQDLFRPRATVYWPDFLLTTMVGWTAFAVSLISDLGTLLFWTAYVLAVLFLYRALLFIHELTHLKPAALPGFRWAWNFLIGIPFLVPSLTYESVHLDHHRRTIYGTAQDPEYLPLARGSPWRVVMFVAESLFAPLLFALRFVVLSPVALLVPPLRRLLLRRASSLVINPAYERGNLDPRERREFLVVEVIILAASWSVVGLALVGKFPLRFFGIWFATTAGIALINQVRTAAAHRFQNGGEEMDVVGQLLDTVNVPGAAWTEIWAPVGLRYHALHHYLPDLPYHALGNAHRRLMKSLPPEAPYRSVNERSLWSALQTLWGSALRTRAS